MKLIYVFTTRMLTSYNNEYGISYFRDKGWDIEIFDMSPIITPEAYKQIKSGVYEGSDLRFFYSKREYKAYVNAMKAPAVFVFCSSNRLATRFMFSSLRKKHIYGLLWIASTTSSPISVHQKQYFLSRIKAILNSLYIRLPHRLQGIPPVGFLITSPGESHDKMEELIYKDSCTVIKHVQCNDFEQYIKVKKIPRRLILEKYCVFIDEYEGYHPDTKDIGVVYTKEEIDLYYKEMRNLFKHIENSMGLRVVIALHPRADYSNHPECYEGFTALRFKTAELIKDCEFVLTHMSEAQSYVMLFHKPCIAVNTTMIKTTPYSLYNLKLFKERFRVKVIDVSDNKYMSLNLKDYLCIDRPFYDSCIRKFYYRDYEDENTEVKSICEQIEECIKETIKSKRKQKN